MCHTDVGAIGAPSNTLVIQAMVFQPGQSGNPGGKRKEKLWTDALRKASLEIDFDGNRKIDNAARSLVKAAVGGDITAAKELGDRLDGKAVQPIAGADGEGPVDIVLAHLRESREQMRGEIGDDAS